AVTAPAGATIWEAAREAGVQIPVLCHHPRLAPVGVCRVCAVEVEGGTGLAASCVRQAEPGMVVHTVTPRVRSARRMLVELLLADYPKASAREARGETDLLLALARAEGIEASRFAGRSVTDGRDDSSKVIAVDHNACILCDRCIRACDEVQVNEVIGRQGKGYAARIAFDNDRPMGASTCVSCGECASVCPTGALVDKLLVPIRAEALREIRRVGSVCPYCGVGCAITYHMAGNTIVQVTGREESPGNQGRLCVKGRYGYDYAHHAERLTVPLIRRPEFPKRPESDPDPMRCFREATWEEALGLAAATWRRIREESGPSAFAGFGSAKCSNEDNYLFQKLVRAVFGTNNVDH
ncbi:MAG: 2Fe-2S iron-sulfur cluster-binding protein, partial [Gemmatimonadales bacterium]